MRAHRAAHGQFPAPAQDWDVFIAAHLAGTGQQAPGLAVAFVFGFPCAVRTKMQTSTPFARLNWNDVPDVRGNQVSCDKINVVLPVSSSAAARVVTTILCAMSTFHLHPPEIPPRRYQNVIRIHIPPRLRYSQI